MGVPLDSIIVDLMSMQNVDRFVPGSTYANGAHANAGHGGHDLGSSRGLVMTQHSLDMSLEWVYRDWI